MKLKAIINICVAAAALGALTSCDDFLDREPYDQVDAQQELTDEVAIAMINGCYTPLQSTNLYNMRMWTLDIVAGNSNVGAGGGDDGLETIQAANFVTQADNGLALYLWRSPWVGIGHCNETIAGVLNSDGLSDEVRDQVLGQAYFLRAHYYYILARLYGGVPLRTEPFIPGQSPAIARASLEETYDLILKDLDRAINLLPAKSEWDASNVGRACREAAYYQLADVYLTLAPSNPALYDEVIAAVDEINAEGYDLSAVSYADIFNPEINNGPESIFEVQFSGSTEYDFWGNTPQCNALSTFMGPRNSDLVAGGWGWNQPTQEFMDQYEDGDVRKEVTCFYEGCPAFDGTNYRADWSNTGYNVRKFIVSKNVSPEYNTNPANFIVYRYAGAVLMQAEALNETDLTGPARILVNKVRQRAGLTDLPTNITKEQLRQAIIKERRLELAFEGHRWFDMIRIDGGQYAIDFLRSIGKANVNKNRLLFPIPQTERDANPLIEQNPGY